MDTILRSGEEVYVLWFETSTWVQDPKALVVSHLFYLNNIVRDSYS
jgi:hypothetical protein